MADESTSTLGTGVMVGILVVIAIIAFMFMSTRSGGNAPSTTPNAGTSGGTNVEIPDDVDVDLN